MRRRRSEPPQFATTLSSTRTPRSRLCFLSISTFLLRRRLWRRAQRQDPRPLRQQLWRARRQRRRSRPRSRVCKPSEDRRGIRVPDQRRRLLPLLPRRQRSASGLKGGDCTFAREWGQVSKTGRCLLCSAVGHQKRTVPPKTKVCLRDPREQGRRPELLRLQARCLPRQWVPPRSKGYSRRNRLLSLLQLNRSYGGETRGSETLHQECSRR